MKIKNLIILLSFLVIAISCQKERDEVSVMYYIKGLALDYTVSYINEDGKTITESVSPSSTDYLWTYNFKGVPGDLVYLYTKYYDINPVMGSFKVMIKVDNKIFKYSDNYDKFEVTDSSYVIKRSGVIPF